jgi:hypothetical protein
MSQRSTGRAVLVLAVLAVLVVGGLAIWQGWASGLLPLLDEQLARLGMGEQPPRAGAAP